MPRTYEDVYKPLDGKVYSYMWNQDIKDILHKLQCNSHDPQTVSDIITAIIWEWYHGEVSGPQSHRVFTRFRGDEMGTIHMALGKVEMTLGEFLDKFQIDHSNFIQLVKRCYSECEVRGWGPTADTDGGNRRKDRFYEDDREWRTKTSYAVDKFREVTGFDMIHWRYGKEREAEE